MEHFDFEDESLDLRQASVDHIRDTVSEHIFGWISRRAQVVVYSLRDIGLKASYLRLAYHIHIHIALRQMHGRGKIKSAYNCFFS